MENYIEYTVLYNVLFNIKNFSTTGNRAFIEDIQEDIKLAKNIDYSIKTQAEYNKKQNFIESSHGPKRSAMFLLNYFGELYLHEGSLTIEADDPTTSKAVHMNTYQLSLKDLDTHIKLYQGNPTKEDRPYDFNTKFKAQKTYFIESGKLVDTTGNPWDSFQNVYTEPYRTLDFKGAFWKSGNEHSVHYILQLQEDTNLACYIAGTKITKKIIFEPLPTALQYHKKYFEVLELIEFFNKHWYLTWDNFIFNPIPATVV